MPQQSFYPALKNLLKTEFLPEPLDTFLTESVDKIFYKNYYNESSALGDVAFHRLTLVFNSAIGFNILGSKDGLELLFNPGSVGGTTELPLSLTYNWPILKYKSKFKLESLGTIADYFNLLFGIIGAPPDELLVEAILVFFDGYEEPLAQFVEEYNLNTDNVPLFLPVLDEEGDNVDDIINQLKANNVDILDYVFNNFVYHEDLSVAIDNISVLIKRWLGEFSLKTLKQLVIPHVTASVDSLTVALAFPRKWLIPVNSSGQPLGGEQRSLLRFNVGSLEYNTPNGFEFNSVSSFDFDRSEIANTGIILSFNNAKLDFSRTRNIPEAELAGYPTDFIGIFVQQANIEISRLGKPDETGTNTNAAIIGRDLLIGTGGVSGTITIESGGKLYRKFGQHFKAELDEFSITFRQNSVTGSSIKGSLTIPGYKKGNETAKIGIQAAIKEEGDFYITAIPPEDAPIPISLAQVFELKIRSLTFGNEGDSYYLTVAGTLDFIANVPLLGQVLPKGIEIEKLRIWDDGRLEFEGGGIKVPKAFKVKVGPAKLEVTNMSLGSHRRTLNGVERKYNFFGFDGMINTGRAGVEATGNGFKYYFTTDHINSSLDFHSYISIDGIEIDMSIPGNVSREKAAFLLKGFLSVSNPSKEGSVAGTEYTGSISFTLPKLKFGGSAGMRLNPAIPAFVVDAGLEIANPIPLGGTGLGIYGFRGLLGQHYMPSKQAANIAEGGTWFDYYKAPEEGINVNKFASKSGFSVGAGVSLATAFDSGKVFSTKLFLLLGLPDVFLIEGQAAMLRNRISLDEDVDPPFRAVIIFGDRSVRGNLSVNYRLPESSGAIMTLQGALDLAFFFNNASGWYLNLGKDQPESERIRSKVLTLFQAYAYLMLSSRGIKAGAGAKFDFNKKIGPVGVGLGAFLNLGGFVNFKPVQIGGFIELGGYAYLKISRFKVGFSIAAGLAVEAPHPFNIAGYFELQIKLPWPFKKIKVRVDLSWRFNNDYGPLKEPVAILALSDPEATYVPASAVNILTNETFTVNYFIDQSKGADNRLTPPELSDTWAHSFDSDDIVIPLDSFIDIELLKPVKPGEFLGGALNQLPDGYTELFPPQKGKGRQIRHTYELTDLKIYIRQDNSWVEYNIYEAVTAITSSDQAYDFSKLKQGYWQFMEPNKYNKIRLLSQNMFSYKNHTINNFSDLDAQNYGKKDVFCYDRIYSDKYINWKNEDIETSYSTATPINFNGFIFKFSNLNAAVKSDTSFGHILNLTCSGISSGGIEITLPESLPYIALEFGGNEQHVEVQFIKRKRLPLPFNRTREQEAILKNEVVPIGAAGIKMDYNSSAHLIDKIVIKCNYTPIPDYYGDLVLGGHYSIPMGLVSIPQSISPDVELNKGLFYVSLYNESFTKEEVLSKTLGETSKLVARWPLEVAEDIVGELEGILNGSPELEDGYYREETALAVNLHDIQYFNSNDDSVIIPYSSALKVENSDFAIEGTVVFEPFTAGVITVLSKLKEEEASGHKKGFSLHLYQATPASQNTSYTADTIPSYSIVLVCYNGSSQSAISVVDQYTAECGSLKVVAKQYKNIFISVNRELDKLEIYVDRILKKSVSIPQELPVTPIANFNTVLKQISYRTESLEARIPNPPVTTEQFYDSIEVLDDGVNKFIQPIWRPNSTYAIKVATRDTVTGGDEHNRNFFFAFKTAGPLGHFHQHSNLYKSLASEDRQEEFKLASLKHYIDYERSSPDAQGRFDLSKPVFYENPEIRVFFTQPYIQAMFSNWSAYKGVPGAKGELEIELLDTAGDLLSEKIVFEDTIIDTPSISSLPDDLKIIYALNKASANVCNPNPITFKRRLTQGAYKFDSISPNKLYSAVFNSFYLPEGTSGTDVNDPKYRVQVHKFSFMSSRYADFIEQVSSFVLDDVNQKYAIYVKDVSFTDSDIDLKLKPLINNDKEDDPENVLNYSVDYDRIIYGGLAIKEFEAQEVSTITLVINTDPDSSNKRILGIIVQNPEPFNDPKLPDDIVKDTISLNVVDTENNTSESNFIYRHSRNNSAVFITNTNLNVLAGKMKLTFRYKLFDGVQYVTKAEYPSGTNTYSPINLKPYIQ